MHDDLLVYMLMNLKGNMAMLRVLFIKNVKRKRDFILFNCILKIEATQTITEVTILTRSLVYRLHEFSHAHSTFVSLERILTRVNFKVSFQTATPDKLFRTIRTFK